MSTDPHLDGPWIDQPFTEVSAHVPNIRGTSRIGLAGMTFLIDVTKGFVRQTLETRKASQDQAAQPGQQTLTDAGLWYRFQIDWRLGAGQPHFDRPESSDRRFASSKGTDGWTAGELSLLNDTTLIRSSSEGNLFTLAIGNALYVVDGTNLVLTSNAFDAVPTFTTIALGHRGRDITTDGAYVYVITDSGVFRTLIGSNTASAWSTFQGDHITYANGRIIAAVGGRIVEIDAAGDAGGADVLDYTHPNPSFQWTAVRGAPNAIYAAGYSGDRSQVYAITPNTNTGGLRVPVWACDVPDGETINALAQYGSLVVLGTSLGFRLAQISGNANLVHGDAIEIPGGVFCFEPQGAAIWFGWSNYDQASTGLGRMGLRELTEPLVPAYSSDLMATTQGHVVSVCTVSATKRVFTVAGVGVFAESDELVASGTLDGGEVGWSTFAMKTAAAMDVRHKPLQGRVVARVQDEAGIVTDAGASASQASLGPAEPFEMTGVHGEAIHPVVVLERLDETHGPTLKRWTLGAVVRPKRQDKFTLPLMFRSMDKDRDGVPYTMDTAQAMRELKSIENTGQIVILDFGDDSFRVQIDRIVQAEPQDWDAQHGGLEGIVLVDCITQAAGI